MVNEKDHYLIKIFIGCVISALFIWFIAVNIKWSETLATLKNIQPKVVMGIACLFILFFAIKAIRWSYILQPVSHKNPLQLFPVMMAGVMINATLSVLVGEIIRSVMLGKQFRLSKSSILATIFVERLFDIMTLLALLASAVMLTTLEYPAVRLVILFGIAILLFLSVIAVALWRAPSLKVLEYTTRWMPEHIREMGLKRISLAIEGLGAFTKPKLISTIFLLSVILWLTMGVANYLAIESVGIQVPFSAAIFVMVINAFALVLPSSPGYLGIFEFGYILGLEAYGIDPSDALAAALVYHLIYLLTVALIGIPSWSLVEKKQHE